MTDTRQVQELIFRVLGEADCQQIDRLGGLTNRTYKVMLGDGRQYVVRLPGEGTEEMIDRAKEKVSTQLACRLGIDTELLFFGEYGEKVSAFIDGAQTMSQEAFAAADIVKKAAETLRTLHTCGEDTGVSFDVFDMAAEYEAVISANHVALFDGYAKTKNSVMNIRQKTKPHYVPDVPCHNDPLCENWVLGKNGKLYLIDWEYAGMNDAMWDLADVSIEAAFTDRQDEELLLFYFGRQPEYAERLRFHANKLYLDYLWALWGKARVPFGGAAMELYGTERYERLKRNLVAFEKKYCSVE